MGPRRRTIITAGLVAFAVAAPIAGGADERTSAAKPVIGKPVAAPARPTAGHRFAVAFKVTRSDSGAALSGGRLLADPSIAGRVLPHTESFKNGAARLGLLVPADAGGKSLRVKVTVKWDGASATRLASFPVLQGAKPTVSVDDAEVFEASGTTTTLSFPVTLSAASSAPVSVAYATADGTATAPSDYAAASGTLRFAPGEISKQIDVAVVGDTTFEPDEMLTVRLSTPVGATLLAASATGTIRNDDPRVRPGHYEGKTSQNELWAFDVTGDGGGVTHLRSGQINESCTSYNLSGGDLDFGSYTIPISSDGTFNYDQTYKGTVNTDSGTVESTGHLVITGRFTDGGASGTLLDTLTFGGESCSSGAQTWSASRTG